MAGCNPEIGCRSVAELKEGLADQRTEAAVHAERLRVAADQAERNAEQGQKMIAGFEQCLLAIEKYNAETRVSLATGEGRMHNLEGAVEALDKRQRYHETDPDGMHKKEAAQCGKDTKWVWRALGVTAGGVGYIGGFLLYTHTWEFLEWWAKLLGFH